MKDTGRRVALSLILAPFSVAIHGFVLAKLWGMFMTTIGLPGINFIQAAGIMLVIDFILMKIDWDDKFENSDYDKFVSKVVAHALLTPFVVLGLGYILSKFL